MTSKISSRNKKGKAIFMAFLFILALWPFFASAEKDYGYFAPIINFDTLESDISSISFNALVISSIIIAAVVTISLLKKEMSDAFKRFSYAIIAGPVIATTLFMSVSTIYLNRVSWTGGPVHWHADFKIFACGQEIDLINPVGISNRIGTPVFHEHGDNRIHVEGPVLKPGDVDLKTFFEVIGGSLNNQSVTLPTDNGPVTFSNGSTCQDGSVGHWEVFVYKTDIEIKNVTQEKLINFAEYTLSPYGVVPPADCIIMEFTTQEKNKTDNICVFYQIELNKESIHLVE